MHHSAMKSAEGCYCDFGHVVLDWTRLQDGASKAVLDDCFVAACPELHGIRSRLVANAHQLRSGMYVKLKSCSAREQESGPQYNSYAPLPRAHKCSERINPTRRDSSRSLALSCQASASHWCLDKLSTSARFGHLGRSFSGTEANSERLVEFQVHPYHALRGSR